jgi:hypothetical protein
MKRPTALLLLVLPAIAVAQPPILSATSYGPVTFGIPLEKLEQIAGEKAPPITNPDDNFCRRRNSRLFTQGSGER